jgi:hypothetical protein
MLKNEESSLMLLSKLDKAIADARGYLLSTLLPLVPEVSVVLFSFSNDARLFAGACNASELVRALCRISLGPVR